MGHITGVEIIPTNIRKIRKRVSLDEFVDLDSLVLTSAAYCLLLFNNIMLVIPI